MPWKPGVRVLGFDDAPSSRGDARVPVVGVAMRGPAAVEAVLRTDVTGDGDDATPVLADAVAGYRGRSNVVAVLVHNLMVAGFNVLDIHALAEATGIPVLAVMKGAPDPGAIQRALVERVPGGEAKLARYQRAGPGMPIPGGHAWAAGMAPDEARALLASCTVRGVLPEPLRLAHVIARGWVLGQS